MDRDKYNQLINGEPFQIDMSKTDNYYRKVYNFNDDYIFIADEPKYIVGLKNNPNIVNKFSREDWIYSAYFENGFETIDDSNKRF